MQGSPVISANEEESGDDFEDANQEEGFSTDSVSLHDDAAVLAALRPTPPAPTAAPVVVEKKPEFEGKGKLRKRKAEQEKKDKAAKAATLALASANGASARTDDVTTPTPASPTAPLPASLDPSHDSPPNSTPESPKSTETKKSPTPSTPDFDHSRTSMTETSLRSTNQPANYQNSNSNPWGDDQTTSTIPSARSSSSISSDYSATNSPRTSRTANGRSSDGTNDEEAADSLSPLHNDSNDSSNHNSYSNDNGPSSSSSSSPSSLSKKSQKKSSLTSHSHSNILNNSLPADGEQSIAKIWRSSDSSQHSMQNISLNDEEEEENDQSYDETTASESEVGREDELDDAEEVKKNRRKTVTPSSASMSGQSYDFLLQRLEAQNSQLETDPKAKRASVQGNTKIRASFEKVHREATADNAIDWDFWGRVMSNYEEVASTQPRELSRAIQKGIPPALRGMTWQLMAASKDQDLENTYSQLLKQTSQHEKSISRDLSRTFPKHGYFKDTRESGGVGQENLFNVVKAYSLYDEEVGYTQGLQFIVGPLLLNMPDEEAFCVLVRLMKSYDLRSHYTPNMPGLQLRLFQFDRLLEELLPGVFMHLLRQGVKSSMYASQWFLTLFGYRFPLELVCSVFDLVFAEGVEAIFRFSVAILKRNEKIICELEFDHLLEYLKNRLFEAYAPDSTEDGYDALYKADEFVREALQIKITPLMLDQFGEEWENLCQQQNAHTAEIENLRKANSQLSATLRQLEASLSQINIEHCDLVRQVVESKLEREELEDELIKYKIMFADLAHLQSFNQASSNRASQLSPQ